MDATSVTLGSDTRDRLKEYKAENGFQNYDEAVKSLLQRVEN